MSSQELLNKVILQRQKALKMRNNDSLPVKPDFTLDKDELYKQRYVSDPAKMPIIIPSMIETTAQENSESDPQYIKDVFKEIYPDIPEDYFPTEVSQIAGFDRFIYNEFDIDSKRRRIRFFNENPDLVPIGIDAVFNVAIKSTDQTNSFISPLRKYRQPKPGQTKNIHPQPLPDEPPPPPRNQLQPPETPKAKPKVSVQSPGPIYDKSGETLILEEMFSDYQLIEVTNNDIKMLDTLKLKYSAVIAFKKGDCKIYVMTFDNYQNDKNYLYTYVLLNVYTCDDNHSRNPQFLYKNGESARALTIGIEDYQVIIRESIGKFTLVHVFRNQHYNQATAAMKIDNAAEELGSKVTGAVDTVNQFGLIGNRALNYTRPIGRTALNLASSTWNLITKTKDLFKKDKQ